MVENLPLEFNSAVQMLFLMSLLHEKKVVLDTIRLQRPPAPPLPHVYEPYPELPDGPPYPLFPAIRIEVSPDGKVKVTEADKADWERPRKKPRPYHRNKELSEKGRKAVDTYRADLMTLFSEQQLEQQWENTPKNFQQAINAFIGQDVLSSESAISGIPYVSDALREFAQLFPTRLARALQLARKGHSRIGPGKGQGRVALSGVVPIIPSFQFDSKAKAYLAKVKPLAPVDGRSFDNSHIDQRVDANEILADTRFTERNMREEDFELYELDDNSTLITGQHSPGDVILIDTSNGGSGKGGKEGPDGPGQDPNQDAGKRQGEVTEVGIPLRWKSPWSFGDRPLRKSLELPNPSVNRKMGCHSPRVGKRRNHPPRKRTPLTCSKKFGKGPGAGHRTDKRPRN